MIVLIAYDVSSDRNRAKLHKFLKEFGLNTQKSVFECDLDDQSLKKIVQNIHGLINLETDSVRLYKICSSCTRKMVVSGRGLQLTQLDFLVS